MGCDKISETLSSRVLFSAHPGYPDSPASRFTGISQAFPAFVSIETSFLYTVPRESNTTRLGYPHIPR